MAVMPFGELRNHRALSPNRGVVPLVLPCLMATLVSAPLTGQSIRGRVTEENTTTPLSAVAVSLLDHERVRVAHTRTNEEGYYELTTPRPGTYWLRFRLPGFEVTNVGPIAVAEDKVVVPSLELRPLPPVALDTVVVEGERVPWYLQDFYRRRSQKLGSFLTQQDIERYWPARTTDLIPRLSGFQLKRDPNGNIYVRNTRPAGLNPAGCPPLLFLDGAIVGTTDSHDIDDLLWVENIGGIEAYGGPARMPPEFNMTGSACGVIVFWTKR